MDQEKISRYRIIQKLGSGGMGEVYLAEDTRLGRKVALKLLVAELTQNRDRLARFEQEAYAASALNHPNILTVYEMGDEGGHHFIATEFVDGVTLRKRLIDAPIDLTEVLSIAIQIADAIEEAHSVGIIHRDLKPENIMIRRNGHVKVLDFGLAKLAEPSIEEADTEAVTRFMIQTDAGVVLGTSQYMSPEQARGKPVDRRSDIWSLGVVLYEMIAGRRPFTGETRSDVIIAIAKEEPGSFSRLGLSVPVELEWIVMKALRKNPDERYQTIREFESDLKKLKQRLDFQNELERSMPPEAFSTSLAASGLNLSVSNLQTDLKTATSTNAAEIKSAAQRPAETRLSSAEYLVTGLRRHKALIASAILVVVLVAIGIFYFTRNHNQAALTDKDTILLADFVNTTGDPVFDGTLKQALTVELRQSPFFDIFPDDGVRDTLKFMNRSPDERLTRDVAREISERQGIKALLLGSISGAESHYQLSLEVVNAHTGDTIAKEQIEAEAKDQVLRSLGKAASRLREKLGESLASIQRFDVPLEQVTTSSLDALRAYSLGLELHSKGKYAESIQLYKRAIDLDNNFAIAYARLASVYNNTGQFELSRQASAKAYEFRDRASERERLLVTATYYGSVTGEWDKQIEQLELWKQTFPRDWEPHNLLAVRYTVVGPYEKVIEEAREAIRLNPKEARAYTNLAVGFIGLNKFDEAKNVLRDALSQNLETTNMHIRLYQIALIQGDATETRDQIDWAMTRTDDAPAWQSQAAEFSGQLARANQFTEQAIGVAQRNNAKESAAQQILQEALRNATFGNCEGSNAKVAEALALSREQARLVVAANTFAICNQAAAAESLIDELSKRFPLDSLVNVVSIPLTRAQLDLNRGGSQVVHLLEPALRYEMAGEFWPQYLRGQAYLKQKQGAEAAREFQSIIDHRGWYPLSPLYPLAHLGLARAAILEGNQTQARKSFQDFFAYWKDADPAIPILVAAHQEYDKLK